MIDVTEKLAGYLDSEYPRQEAQPVVVEIAEDFAPKTHTIQLRVLTSPDCLQAIEFLSEDQLSDVTKHLLAYFAAKGRLEEILLHLDRILSH